MHVYKKIACQLNLKGACHFGDKCRYSHAAVPAAPAVPAEPSAKAKKKAAKKIAAAAKDPALAARVKLQPPVNDVDSDSSGHPSLADSTSGEEDAALRRRHEDASSQDSSSDEQDVRVSSLLISIQETLAKRKHAAPAPAAQPAVQRPHPALPAKSSAHHRMWLCDTGCPHDLIGKQDCTAAQIEQGRPGPITVILETANGELSCDVVMDLQITTLEKILRPISWSLLPTCCQLACVVKLWGTSSVGQLTQISCTSLLQPIQGRAGL